MVFHVNQIIIIKYKINKITKFSLLFKHRSNIIVYQLLKFENNIEMFIHRKRLIMSNNYSIIRKAQSTNEEESLKYYEKVICSIFNISHAKYGIACFRIITIKCFRRRN